MKSVYIVRTHLGGSFSFKVVGCKVKSVGENIQRKYAEASNGEKKKC